MATLKLVDHHSLVEPKHKAFLKAQAKKNSSKGNTVSGAEVLRAILDSAMKTAKK